ncbi:MAG: aldehyde-activating protein, partial [Pseudomonadota bacterium]
CKRIKYAFDGDPLWVAHCHCETCRRATSSAFATYVGVKLDQFRYYEGEPAWYESSPGVHRYFCGNCGSPMAYIGDKFAGTVHLYAGSLAEPDKVKPMGNLNAKDRLPWTEVHNELPEIATLSEIKPKPAKK